MNSAPANFDRLARGYAALEYFAFGHALERARFHYLDTLRDRRAILVLGEGDGRCVARLLALAPKTKIRCVDASGAMIAVARHRINGSVDADRVEFVQADARTLDLPAGHFDAIVTLFFLDCFAPAEAGALMEKLTAAAAPDALWLFSDFAVPPCGFRRWRARAWLALLYFFFRQTTRLAAHTLPDTDAIFRQNGWQIAARRDWQAGLLTSAVWRHANSQVL
jgi:SAM-dependent methyltransferase